MVRLIIDEEEKKAVARLVLEELRMWFEVEESRENGHV